MMESFTFQSKLTAQDYKRVVFFASYGKSRLIKLLMLVWIFMASVLLGGLIKTGYMMFPTAFYSVVIVFCVVVFGALMLNGSVNSYIKTGKVKVDQIRTMTVDESGVSLLLPDLTKQRVEYQDFLNIYETKRYFIFYVNSLGGVILTKRDMKDEQILSLRQHLIGLMKKRFIMR